jgi:hypothetical protein
MTAVTRVLSAIEQGDPSAVELLLPLVYDELRKLAAQKPSPRRCPRRGGDGGTGPMPQGCHGVRREATTVDEGVTEDGTAEGDGRTVIRQDTSECRDATPQGGRRHGLVSD